MTQANAGAWSIKCATMHIVADNKDQLYVVRVFVPQGMTLGKARRLVEEKVRKDLDPKASLVWRGFYDVTRIATDEITLQ